MRDRSQHKVAVECKDAPVIGQPNLRHFCARNIAAQASLPALPVAIALDGHRHWFCRPDKLSEHAASRRIEAHVEVEAIAVGLCVKQQRQPVSRGRVGVELDHRAAVPNVRACREMPGPPLAGAGGRFNREVFNRKPAEADVEAGENWALLCGGVEFGDFVERRPRNIEARDIKPVGKPARWGPVKPRVGHVQEQPFGIIEPDVPQAGLGIDRTIDPTDPDAEPGCRRLRGDLVRNEAMTDTRVGDPEQECG